MNNWLRLRPYWQLVTSLLVVSAAYIAVMVTTHQPAYTVVLYVVALAIVLMRSLREATGPRHRRADWK
jgi:hypothetical protein